MTTPANPQPGNRDEPEVEIVRRWMLNRSQVPEGVCSDAMCWYTLPLVDGLVVAHSGAGTLDPCDGAGRPPQPAPSAGQDTERLRDELAPWLVQNFFWGIEHGRGHEAADMLIDGPLRQLFDQRDEDDDTEYDEMRTRLLAAIRERDEARARVARVESLLRDLFAAVERGDEYGLPEAYRAAAEHLRAGFARALDGP